VTARLIVSVSGVADGDRATLDVAAGFAAELDARAVPLSLLVRPRGPAGTPAPDAAVIRWLHERRGSGDAVVLHGYDHTRDPLGHGGLGVVRGRRAEFATLPQHEAGLRLTAARRALTRLSLRTTLFAPPRWLASAGTVEALREQGFRLLADETTVRFLGVGLADEQIHARVLGRGWNERPRLGADLAAVQSWRGRVLVSDATRTARAGRLVRIDARAEDLRRPARREAVLQAVDAALALGAAPDTYRLLARPAARAA
jgi:predicted deacetylase